MAESPPLQPVTGESPATERTTSGRVLSVVSRCNGYREDVDQPCTGNLWAAPGDRTARCDTCNGQVGMGVLPDHWPPRKEGRSTSTSTSEGTTMLPTITNRRIAEAMGDYRNIEAEPEGLIPALDDLAEAVCGTGGHIPNRDRSLPPCDFHRRMAAGYLRVVEAADA